MAWQGSVPGDPEHWNTFLQRSTDGGATWEADALRLSDAPDGAAYKDADGYAFPYGDYIGIAVDALDATHVIWGESPSYNGPGGTWWAKVPGP